eukprot:454468_1
MALNNDSFNEMKHSDLNEFFAYVHPTNVTGLNSNNKLITSIPGHGSFNYGNTLIHSQTKSVYKWTFKIMEGGRSMVIGIFGSNSKDVWVTDNKWTSNTLQKLPAQRAYGMLGKGQRVIFQSQVSMSDYGSKINTGDIITMTLNLISKQLSFAKNNNDFGIAFKDIKIGKNFYYHLMIKFGTPQKVQSVAIQSLYKIANDTPDRKHHVRSDLKHRNNKMKNDNARITMHFKNRNTDDIFSLNWKIKNHIYNIRHQVYKRNMHLNIPKSQFILLYGNTVLMDHRTIDYYQLKNGITIEWYISKGDEASKKTQLTECQKHENRSRTVRSNVKHRNNKNEIRIYLQEMNTNNKTEIKWNIHKKWFGSKIKRKIKKRFYISDDLLINVMYKKQYINNEFTSAHYGISNGDTLIWYLRIPESDRLVILLQKLSNSERSIKVYVSKNTVFHQMEQMIGKAKYTFIHNGMVVSNADCFKHYNITNGDTIYYQIDNGNGFNSRIVVIDYFLRLFVANDSCCILSEMFLLIKRYLLITNIAESLGIPIYIICDVQSCVDKLNELQSNNPKFVGFDCEWKRQSNQVDLIQIADRNMVLLIRVHLLHKIPDELHSFCSNENIKKCGVGLKQDACMLRNGNQIFLKGYVELNKTLYSKKKMSLEKLSNSVLGQQMVFKKCVNHFRWKSDTLDHVQIGYAADDAMVGFLLFEYFTKKKRVNPSLCCLQKKSDIHSIKNESLLNDKKDEKKLENILENKAVLKFKHWIKNIVGLPQYLPLFEDNEYCDISMVQFFENDVLNEIGINNQLHRKLILEKVNEFKLMSNDLEMMQQLKPYKYELIKYSILTIEDLRNEVKSINDVTKIFDINDDGKIKEIFEAIYNND